MAHTKFDHVVCYLRFSSDGQSDGHSFERQRLAARRYLEGLGIPETAVEWLEDPRRSAYRGSHLRRGVLGKFLERVRTGERSKGLFLCEQINRASRQGAMPLLAMVHTLNLQGWAVKFLQDGGEAITDGEMPDFLGTRLAIAADIAHQESKVKSQFSRANWEKRRKLARENHQPLTKECPTWLRVVEGSYVPIPEKVDAIRQVFELARDGWGVTKIVRFANGHALPVPGKGTTWHNSLVQRLFGNFALVGRLQPWEVQGINRVPAGDPVEGYYPTVIDQSLFHSVRALRAKAAKFPKRRGENNYNYLLGLAKCECGGTWRRLNKNSGGQVGYAQYSCSNRQRNVTACPNVSARVFDFHFIAFACDVIPNMLQSGDDRRKDQVASIEMQLADLNERYAALMTFIEVNKDLAAETGKRMRDIIAKRDALQAELISLRTTAPPDPGFEFGDAVGVFIPAYLDVYPDGSPEGVDAYRARALFTSRVIESVASVHVAVNRDMYKVILRNGVVVEQPLELDMEFGPADHDEETLAEVGQARRQRLSRIRRVNNNTPPAEDSPGETVTSELEAEFD